MAVGPWDRKLGGSYRACDPGLQSVAPRIAKDCPGS